MIQYKVLNSAVIEMKCCLNTEIDSGEGDHSSHGSKVLFHSFLSLHFITVLFSGIYKNISNFQPQFG